MFNGLTALVTGSTSGIGSGHRNARSPHEARTSSSMASAMPPRSSVCAPARDEHGVTVRYDGADLSKQDADRGDDGNARSANSVPSTSSSTTPASSSSRRSTNFPVDEVERDPVALNLSASFHTIRLALPAMKARKWGRIINIASAHALVASPYKSAYVAAKHGIAGLTKTVALEVAAAGHHDERDLPGLRVDAARREADPRHREGARHSPSSR